MMPDREKVNDKRKQHPFAITCRYCGSHHVMVLAEDYRDLEIRCRTCGTYVDCSTYYTDENDYSETLTIGKNNKWREDDA